MKLTEKEARTKWCPQARLAPMSNSASTQCEPQSNRDDNWDSVNCIASGCMAWRWSDSPDRPIGGELFRGYCGLAGAP